MWNLAAISLLLFIQNQVIHSHTFKYLYIAYTIVSTYQDVKTSWYVSGRFNIFHIMLKL